MSYYDIPGALWLRLESLCQQKVSLDVEGLLVISEISSMPRIGYFELENYGVPCHANIAHGKQYIHAFDDGRNEDI